MRHEEAVASSVVEKLPFDKLPHALHKRWDERPPPETERKWRRWKVIR